MPIHLYLYTRMQMCRYTGIHVYTYTLLQTSATVPKAPTACSQCLACSLVEGWIDACKATPDPQVEWPALGRRHSRDALGISA